MSSSLRSSLLESAWFSQPLSQICEKTVSKFACKCNLHRYTAAATAAAAAAAATAAAATAATASGGLYKLNIVYP
jgi:hypothetical protein